MPSLRDLIVVNRRGAEPAMLSGRMQTSVGGRDSPPSAVAPQLDTVAPRARGWGVGRTKPVDETNRRREKQEAFNAEHGIVPETIYRSREEILQASSVLESVRGGATETVSESRVEYDPSEDVEELLSDLEKQMKSAAANLDFEKAAHLRDEIARLKEA